jgi:hypothetical protein
MITRELYERGPSHLPRFFNAILFSVNVSFASISLLFLFFPRLFSGLIMDFSNKLFDLSRGQFAAAAIICWTSALLLASVLWMIHAVLWQTTALSFLLHSAAGFIALCTPMAVLVCVNENSRHMGTRFWVGAIELPLALVIAFLFQNGKVHFGSFIGTTLLAAHFMLWFWVFGNIWVATYEGPTGAIFGFMAGLAWGAQVEADAFSRYLRGTDVPICF